MDLFEKWLRERAATAPVDESGVDPEFVRIAITVINGLADEWHDSEHAVVMDEFLRSLDGPTMLGFEPSIYPACIKCGQAWMCRRTRGVWAWYPDCTHKTATCKLVHNSLVNT